MKRVTYEPPRPRTPWTWGGAILLLGTLVAGLLGAAILLWRHIDIESLLDTAEDEQLAVVDVSPPQLRLPPLPVTSDWQAYVYVSGASASFFPDTLYLHRLAARWDSLLSAAGASTVRLADADALSSLGRGALLVVPAAICLEVAEREGLRAHVLAGGDLIISWAFGTRDGSCDWRGFGLLEEMTGSRGAVTLDDRPPRYLTLPHGSVVAAGLPPGSRVELENEPWITLRAEALDPVWSDWALNPLPAADAGAAAAIVARRTEHDGRMVWFGYRFDVPASERDRRLLDRVAVNAALWAGGQVVPELEPWPGGHRAALSVTQDVEHGFPNSRRLAGRFQTLGVPVTFFVVTKLARAHPELAGLLTAAGEVASHSVDHRQTAGRFWGTQLAAARQARQDIVAWADVAPRGFRPPREIYDEATLETWRRQGGLYVAGSNDARSAAPELFDLDAGSLVVLPRVVDDDYAVMVLRGELRTDSLRAAFLSGLDKMRRLGGLDLVTVHSQLIDSEQRIEAVEAAVLAAREAGDVWIARAMDIADWWLRRADVFARVEQRADGSVRVSVSNAGAEPVAPWLRLHLPDDPLAYAAPEAGERILDARFEDGAMRIALPEIPPGGRLELLVPRRFAPETVAVSAASR